MYRIKDDKRVEASVRKISEGLRQCLQQKRIDQISVSDITKAADVSRATFYRLFDTPTDVLSYICDTFARKSMKELSGLREDNRKDYFIQILRFWMTNSEVAEMLFRSGKPHIIENSFEKYPLLSRMGKYDLLDSESEDYIKASFGSVIGSILYVWIKHGKKESPEQLSGLFEEFCNNFI